MKTLATLTQLLTQPLALRQSVAQGLVGSMQGFTVMVEDEAPGEGAILDSVAIIPVRGVLAQDMSWWCDGTSYDWIREGFDAALADPAVKGIVLDINSPGGGVHGCADLADHIYNARGTKPIWAILSENAYSAAYWLASSADHITVPRTGGAGSIGCLWCHFDISKMLKNAGIEVTYIQAGSQKTLGAAEKPLSDEARAYFQAGADEVRELFAATVARGRGIDVTKVMATEAACLNATDALAAGLCDEILSPDAAMQSLLNQLA